VKLDERERRSVGGRRVKLDERELCTALAALRMWSECSDEDREHFHDIVTNAGAFAPLDMMEVENLMDKLNSNWNPSDG